MVHSGYLRKRLIPLHLSILAFCMHSLVALSCQNGMSQDLTPSLVDGLRSLVPVGDSGIPTEAHGFISMNASYDASCIVAAAAQGKLYYSDDGGTVWWTMDGLGRQEYWTGIAVSADGQRLATAGQSLFVTDDGGFTWMVYPFIDRYDGDIRLCMSGDGSTLLRIGESSLTQAGISRDYGRTWTTVDFNSVGDALEDIGISSDGLTMAVLQYFQPLYLSQDGGRTWNAADTGSEQWSALAQSPDGKHLALLSSGGVKYDGLPIFDMIISHDAGTSWTMRTVDGVSGADAISITPDGSRLLVSGNTVESPFMLSVDGGENWQSISTPEKQNPSWSRYTHVFTASGERIVVMERSYSVWISDDQGLHWIKRLAGVGEE